MKIERKSQISIFIIVSAIIVLSILLFLLLKFGKNPWFQDETSAYKIKTYVDDCLHLQTKEAMYKIGLDGGWLYHPKSFMPYDRNQIDILNQKATAISQFGVTIPYWYYFDDNNDNFVYDVGVSIPAYDSVDVNSIRGQIEHYLKDNLELNCLRGFEDFKDLYTIEYDPKQIKNNLKVAFDDKNVVTTLDMDIRIISNDNETEHVNQFKSKQFNKLRVPYHIAKDITLVEANTSFIEKSIIAFMTPYKTSANKDLLPPDFDFALKYDYRPWDVQKVKKLTEQIVSSNIDLLRFQNTNPPKVTLPEELQDNAFAKGVYKLYDQDFLSYGPTNNENHALFREYSDYKITPKYDGYLYPMFFRLAPSIGNTVLLPRPHAVINLIPIFFTQYNAVYEMTNPIFFKITPKDDNDDFVFNLALESNINYNKPLADTFVFNVSEENKQKKMDSQKSLACDPIQFISANVSLEITDPVNYGKRKSVVGPRVGVKDAIVTFDCKGISTCFVGETKINGKTIYENITNLNFRLPINCYPGTLEIYKYGHKKVVINNLNPTLTKPIVLKNIIMPSEKEKKLRIKKIPLGAPSTALGSSLNKYENGFLIFRNLEDDEIVQVVQFDSTTEDNLDVKLTVGNYSVEGYVIYNQTTIINDNKLPKPINLTSWVTGAYNDKRFEVELDSLLSDKTELSISFVDLGVPTTLGELQSSGTILGDIQGYSHKPRWLFKS